MATAPTQIVIRPSGVWNSRAPLHNYILEIRAQFKRTNTLTLAIYALRHDANASPDPERSGREFLKRVTKTEAVAGQAWVNYRRSFGNRRDGKGPRPTVAQIACDVVKALYDVREMAIVRLSSIFEAFSQCWALNYLVTLLETGQPWSRKEAELALAFNPVHGKGQLAGWPRIVEAIPVLKAELRKVPHLFTDPKTGEKVTALASPDINAFEVIQFWRAYRNLAIHTSRLVTRRFHERHATLFARMMADLNHISPLEAGKQMPLHDDMYSAMAAVQYRAARWMNDLLFEMSSQRRGHPEAPQLRTTEYFDVTPPIPPLFVKGDHEPSLRWATDPGYREELSREQGLQSGA